MISCTKGQLGLKVCFLSNDIYTDNASYICHQNLLRFMSQKDNLLIQELMIFPDHFCESNPTISHSTQQIDFSLS